MANNDHIGLGSLNNGDLNNNDSSSKSGNNDNDNSFININHYNQTNRANQQARKGAGRAIGGGNAVALMTEATVGSGRSYNRYRQFKAARSSSVSSAGSPSAKLLINGGGYGLQPFATFLTHDWLSISAPIVRLLRSKFDLIIPKLSLPSPQSMLASCFNFNSIGSGFESNDWISNNAKRNFQSDAGKPNDATHWSDNDRRAIANKHCNQKPTKSTSTSTSTKTTANIETAYSASRLEGATEGGAISYFVYQLLLAEAILLLLLKLAGFEWCAFV